METITIKGSTYPKAESVEVTLPNGVKIKRHEHPQFKLIQSETGDIYDTADDVESSTFEYGVTDIPKSEEGV